jgi:hypothetical protein
MPLRVRENTAQTPDYSQGKRIGSQPKELSTILERCERNSCAQSDVLPRRNELNPADAEGQRVAEGARAVDV